MMTRTVSILACLSMALCSIGCSGLSKIDVGRVLTSGRDGWQYPDRVVESLEIRAGDHVAEIGAGNGYWLSWLSRAVGSGGRVYAVEVEAALVADLEAMVEKEGLSNVEVILGAYDDPRLAADSIDLALTVLTYHHIENRVDYFKRLQRSLRVGGRVAHLDDRPDAEPPISWFQGEGHWTEPSVVVEEMNHAGYVRQAMFDYLPAQSFQVFSLDATPRSSASSSGLETKEANGS